jgi:hypothetical protein
MGVPINPAWNLDARVAGLPLPPTRYGTNLIFNGNAESISGTNNYTPNRGIAWWFDIASTTLGVYGANVSFPAVASPGPTNRGVNFFLGGTTNGAILQRINISVIADDVDDWCVDYTLSGWFGGAAAQEDWAALTATFLNATGAVLATNIVGRVSAAERGGVTSLLLRSTNGTVPSGTRFVEFMLTNRVVTGSNDGSADNLSFTLTLVAPPFITAYGATTNGWRVEFTTSSNRLYVLERSQDFAAWDELTPATLGSGQTAMLVDTNPPLGQAFYRVARRPP